jgi:hypothetical protein
VTIVSAADLVLKTTNPAIVRAYKKSVDNQAAYLSAAGPDWGAARRR